MSLKKNGAALFFPTQPTVMSYAAVVGKKEKEGPLGDRFDHFEFDEYCGMESFEKAESAMQREAMRYAFCQGEISAKDLDFVFAGDLLNQCIGSNYALRDSGLRYFGIYGACSTFAEGLILSAMAIDGGFARRCAVSTGSHFCSAERQYRYPLEYGAVRAGSAQWTVTGAGCAVISGDVGEIRIVGACPGAIEDYGIRDASNMGAAMAPAAAATLRRYFTDTRTVPSDYDLILTGDLGRIGSDLLKDLLREDGIHLGEETRDAGCEIFSPNASGVNAGGSGAGCIASVLCGVVFPQMRAGTFRNVLAVATGALMSPTSVLQGESIPSIAHLVQFRVGEERE